MKNKIEELLKIKSILKYNDNLYIETTNKEKKCKGCATFYTNGEQKIMVYEGNSDGSDDAGYTYEEFVQKYDYEVKKEG